MEYMQRKARNQAIRAYNEVAPNLPVPPTVPSFDKLKNNPLFWVCTNSSFAHLGLPTGSLLVLWPSISFPLGCTRGALLR